MSTTDERLTRQLDFIRELDGIKSIVRQNYLCDASRRENDAEHSWHIAVMIFLLQEYAEGQIDCAKAALMAMIHDVVEIDAGDTYAYDPQAAIDKAEREIKAADRIFGILPKDQEEYFRGLWEEFEEGKTNEAVFCRAMDVLQPVMLNSASCGKSWKEHTVRRSQVLPRIEAVRRFSDKLYGVVYDILNKAVEEGMILPD